MCQTNLVPNPGFEIYDTCPTQYGGINTGLDQICKAIPWFQPTICPEPWYACACGSTDFFHTCAGSVPNNWNGYQLPRTGNGYAHAGIIVMNQNFGREYLEVGLINPLIPAKKYCTFFYSTLANSQTFVSCDCLSASFSIDTLKQFGSFDMINAPTHIKLENIVTDTLNWNLIKTIYAAGGGEKFITVGCFLPHSQVNYICHSTPSNCAYSAYFFDDFGVYELPEITAGDDYEICEYGGSVQLQASCDGCWDALQYRWWPSVGLSDTSILNPIATPEQTTTYYFGLIDTTETVPCIVDLVDSVRVTVCEGITPPPFNFTIQPNPGNDKVELVFTHVPEDTDLLLYDLRGRLIIQTTIPKETTSYQLDISHLANAQYMLKLQNPVGTVRKKLMKM